MEKYGCVYTSPNHLFPLSRNWQYLNSYHTLIVSSRGKLPLFAVKWPFAGLFSALIYNHEVKADIQYYY